MDNEKIKSGWRWLRFILRCIGIASTGGQKATADRLEKIADGIEDAYRGK